MKKYEKPVVVIENFMFAQTIAANCGINVPRQDVTYIGGIPVWDLGAGQILFDLGSGVCTEDGSLMTGACYNNLGNTETGGAFVS